MPPDADRNWRDFVKAQDPQAVELVRELGRVRELNIRLRVDFTAKSKDKPTDILVIHGYNDQRYRGDVNHPTTIIAPVDPDTRLSVKFYRNLNPAQLPEKPVVSVSVETDYMPQPLSTAVTIQLLKRRQFKIYERSDILPELVNRYLNPTDDTTASLVPFLVYQREEQMNRNYIMVLGEKTNPDIKRLVDSTFGPCRTCSHVTLDELSQRLHDSLGIDLMTEVTPAQLATVPLDAGVYNVEPDQRLSFQGYGPNCVKLL
ncbi:hypothetical protein HYX12_01970 [Candidatus Woesearchaeota archaeon]|nr:hypothetical protein [Candidatus Woesearchaeota archaeon]